MSQLRYLDGLKVTFKFVLAAVMIVNVGMGLAVLDKVLDHEIHCIRWGTKKSLQHVPSVVHSQIICPSACSTYFIESSLLGCILFTLLQILLCICSLCVCTRAQTHTLVDIFNIYLLTFFWERARDFFSAIGFSWNSVAALFFAIWIQEHHGMGNIPG